MIPAILASLGRVLASRAATSAAGAIASRTSGFKPPPLTDSQKYYQHFSQLQQGIGALGNAAKQALSPIDLLTKSMHPFIAKLQEMAPAVAKFNPGAANQFAIASNNFEAAIGRIMTPALQGGTRMIDRFNNVISGLEPVLRPASKALGDMFDSIGKFYQEVGPNLATFWGKAAEAFIGFTKVVELSLKNIAHIAKALNVVLRGIGGKDDLANRYNPKAFTRAVGGTGIANKSEDIYNPAAEAAIQASSGVGTKESPEVQTVNWLESIYNLLAGEFAKKAVQSVKDTAKETVAGGLTASEGGSHFAQGGLIGSLAWLATR